MTRARPPACACGNEARYLEETGALTCGLCPIKAGRRSVRLTDAAETYFADHPAPVANADSVALATLRDEVSVMRLVLFAAIDVREAYDDAVRDMMTVQPACIRGPLASLADAVDTYRKEKP